LINYLIDSYVNGVMQAMQDKVSVHMSLLLLLVRYALLLTVLQYCFLIMDFCIYLLAAPGKYSAVGSHSASIRV
jgi:hypothetical protein